MDIDSNVLIVPKDQIATFERGFKSWCENTSISIRKRLGLSDSSPLSPTTLAASIDVLVKTPEQIPGVSSITTDYLSSSRGDEWSAITVQSFGKKLVVVNSRHSEARKASDIMHELAHIIRGHQPGQVFIHDRYALRDFNDLQENEANWFAGCLLLPRAALISAGYKGLDIGEISRHYGTSISLCNYRMNVTGVRKMFPRLRPQ